MESKKTDLFNQEMELIQTRIMLNKLIELNLSLYHAILDYAERKDIPITLDSRIMQLVEQIGETDKTTFPDGLEASEPNLSDDFSQDKHKRDKPTGTSQNLIYKQNKTVVHTFLC
jgi:hypothetical protein